MPTPVVKEIAHTLRHGLGRCSETFYKQVGLRRVRDALRRTSETDALALLREATQLLQQAKAWDERELSDALR
jgi:hypothetical protein